MWPPADITAIPTENESTDARIAIERVESELKDALLSLEQARLRVVNLEKDLHERKAWIAPIRRLSYDVLSLIFEFCGEDNWRTPLRISGVSRLWRTLVLATPRAWAFLNVHECGDGDEDLIHHFFQHSGHRPLHLILSKSQRYSLLFSIAGRLECLSIDHCYRTNESQCFPRLARLLIRSVSASIEITDLSISQLPALRELICEPIIIGVPPSSIQPTFPPLQVLSVAMVGGMAWLDLLRGCQSSLVSLRLHHVNEDRESEDEVLFPMLKCLEIIIWNDHPEFWAIDMKTPAIETYIEGTESVFPPAGTTPIHGNIGSVTRARIFYATDLSAMLSLHLIQLGSSVRIAGVLSQLQLNPSLCPRLKLIEVPQDVDLAPFEASLIKVNRERAQPISIQKVETWVTALPYEIAQSPVSNWFISYIPTDFPVSAGETCRAVEDKFRWQESTTTGASTALFSRKLEGCVGFERSSWVRGQEGHDRSKWDAGRGNGLRVGGRNCIITMLKKM